MLINSVAFMKTHNYQCFNDRFLAHWREATRGAAASAKLNALMADVAASVASIGESAKFVVFSACPLALGAVARELDRTGMR
jgi:hypothetical protein